MEIILTPDMEEIIAEQIASGAYKNADEVISAAVRLLMEKGKT